MSYLLNLKSIGTKVSEKGMPWYGWCQAGTSAHYTSDGTLLLGAPGTIGWRGKIFSFFFLLQIQFDILHIKFIVGNPEPKIGDWSLSHVRHMFSISLSHVYLIPITCSYNRYSNINGQSRTTDSRMVGMVSKRGS